MKPEDLLKYRVARLLQQAAVEAQHKGLLPQIDLPDIAVEHPPSAAHADYACSLPLKLGRSAGLDPLDIAEKVVAVIAPSQRFTRLRWRRRVLSILL